MAAAQSVPDEARGKAGSAARLLRERLATGRLVLQVSPFGAAVAIDGVDAGVAPIAPVDVTPGRHIVAVRRPGFLALTREVDVRGGWTETVVVELAPAATQVAPSVEAPSIWPWVSLGVGGAVAIGGAVSVWAGEQDHLEIVDAEGYAEGQLVGLSRDRAVALETSGDDKKLMGWVLVGVGSAVMVGSVVWMILDAPSDGAGTVAPVVTGVPGGAALGAAGRF